MASEQRQVAQLSQWDCAAGWLSFGQKWRTATGDVGTFYRRYLQPLWCNWPTKLSNSVEKCKIRAITQSKVIQDHWGWYQSTAVCDFLLVINTNWHPISYRFRVITAYCSNSGHFAFL